MARRRIRPPVDAQLLEDARRAYPKATDAALMDVALTPSHRAAEVDPVSEPDEWGDLAFIREAASAS